MVSRFGDGSVEAVKQIRESILMFVKDCIEQSIGQTTWPIDGFIVNNLVAIVTLCIKIECPETWSTAFTDLMMLASGEGNVNGLSFGVSVLDEMEVEVVEFSSERSQREIQHNTVIKDFIREGTIVQDLVMFLCSSAVSCRQAGLIALSQKALRAFAQMIGWIDVALVVKCALPTIYQCMNDQYISGAACSCVFELVKKGMDPEQKILMISQIELIQNILSMKIEDNGCITSSEEETNPAEELGPVVNIIVVELLGVWTSCEDQFNKTTATLAATTTNANDYILQAAAAFPDIGLTTAGMLRALMPQLMSIFSHSDIDVSSTVIDSVNKLIALLKTQNPRLNDLKKLKEMVPGVFVVEDFLSDLLMTIYQQIQFPHDFTFDADDEDDAMVIEVIF